MGSTCEYTREYRRKKAEQGICYWCGVSPIYRAHTCFECYGKAMAAKWRFQLMNPQYWRDYKRANRVWMNYLNNVRRERLRREGLCVDCGKPNDDLPHIRCRSCYEKNLESQRKWREKKKCGTL